MYETNIAATAEIKFRGNPHLSKWQLKLARLISHLYISRRLANKTSRKDFLTNIVGKVEAGEVSREELTAHASTLA